MHIWHNLWMDCGLPRAGVVAESVLFAGLKRLRFPGNVYRIALLRTKQRDFWMKIKRIRSKNSCTSRVADGNTEYSQAA